MLEKYKHNIGAGIVLVCLIMAGIQVHTIKNNLEYDAPVQPNKFSIDFNKPQYNVQREEVDLTKDSETIWALVNLNFYLFVGGLVYARLGREN